jgi:hypothetical protein
MVNIVLSCMNYLNSIIPGMDWDSSVNDVTVSKLQSVGERRAKIDVCCSSSSSADGYKILYYHHAWWMHLRHRRTLPVTVPSVKLYVGVEV